MAYLLAENLKISHKFNKEKGLAGYDWLCSFLRRNPDLSVRNPEGLSRLRSEGVNKDVVWKYFDLLKNSLEQN